MAAVNPEIFEKFKKAKKLPIRQEADGHEIDVEVREDEEQTVKLQEIVDLLVAAGYFRARIKGLSPFDKIIGGMTWCAESLSIDVDVDLLFQENSTIGQKIALTEKIVAVLTRIKCPFSLEPHQIQGLDFIHIFPVIQWLVKRSMEFREETSAFVRSYAVNQFNKLFGIENKTHETILKNLKTVNEVYRPRRYYKRKNAPPLDVKTQVQITLLEYGTHDLGGGGNMLEQQKTQEQRIQHLLTNQMFTEEELPDYEELDETDMQNLAKHHVMLQHELKSKGEKEIIAIEYKIQVLAEKCAKLKEEKSVLHELFKTSSTQLEKIKEKKIEAETKLRECKISELKKENRVQEIEEMIVPSDTLKSQEQQFREYCKKELLMLQNLIDDLKKGKVPIKKNEKLSNEMLEKLGLLRLQLAKKNRIVATLQRQIDDVPNRPELAQYQKRFLELYNQVSVKHKETKQYYTLYNTLEDTRLYMKKELSLLNSIADSYPDAVLSNFGKEEFLKQFHVIVEGVKQSNKKVELQLLEEKRKRDQMSSALHILIEQQRRYVAAVKQLSIECKRHEALLAEN